LLMLGKKVADVQDLLKITNRGFVGVKEAVFPFNMFPEVDPVLGPEMRATGEVMGVADNFGLAYFKAEEAAGYKLPTSGNVLVTVRERDRKYLLPIARELVDMGFKLIATSGTSKFLKENGIDNTLVKKLSEGRPNIVDLIKNREVQMIINTPIGRGAMEDDSFIRMMAIGQKLPYVTTLAAASASVKGIRAAREDKSEPVSLQEYHQLNK